MTTDVFWTGGWDSTYRVLELAIVHERAVQPHYVLGQRRSIGYEFRALKSILEGLRERFPQAAARIRPFHIAAGFDLPENERVREAFKRLKHRKHLGSQYERLATYAYAHQLSPIELAVLHLLPVSMLEYNERAAHWRLSTENSEVDEDLRTLFSKFAFPLLEMSKRGMLEAAETHGFRDLLYETWFCHTPRRGGRPCGRCTPCHLAVVEGFGHRLPWRARVKHRFSRRRRAPNSVVR